MIYLWKYSPALASIASYKPRQIQLKHMQKIAEIMTITTTKRSSYRPLLNSYQHLPLSLLENVKMSVVSVLQHCTGVGKCVWRSILTTMTRLQVPFNPRIRLNSIHPYKTQTSPRRNVKCWIHFLSSIQYLVVSSSKIFFNFWENISKLNYYYLLILLFRYRRVCYHLPQVQNCWRSVHW